MSTTLPAITSANLQRLLAINKSVLSELAQKLKRRHGRRDLRPSKWEVK